MTTRRGESWDMVDMAEAMQRAEEFRDAFAHDLLEATAKGIDASIMETVETVNVEDILRPLAERTVECPLWESAWHGWGTNPNPECQSCHGPGHKPDPRFEALRLGRYQDAGGGSIPGWRIDASLGAIRAALVACGILRVETTYHFNGDVEVDAWGEGGLRGRGVGGTVEEAEARALVAAVAAP